MASKSAGSGRNGRDSNPKHRGVKSYGGENIPAGSIIVRQCGSKIHAGTNVGKGSDFTLFAKVDGVVKFENIAGGKKRVKIIPNAKTE